MSTSTTSRDDRWPPQIKYIVGNEACERFSFYGMKGILVGYMTSQVLKGGLNMSDDKATSIFHLFVFANYFMPLLGATQTAQRWPWGMLPYIPMRNWPSVSAVSRQPFWGDSA